MPFFLTVFSYYWVLGFFKNMYIGNIKIYKIDKLFI